MIGRLLILLAAAGALIASPVAAAPAAKPDLSLSVRGFVADDVGVFSEAFKEEMKQRLATIQDRTEVTVLLVATGGMPGVESEDIAEALGKSMQAAGKTRKYWTVFLLNPVAREFAAAFSVSAPLPEGTDPSEVIESIDNDAVLRRFAEAFDGPVTPFFKANDWEGGMRAGVDAIERYLADDATTAPAHAAPSAEDGTAT